MLGVFAQRLVRKIDKGRTIVCELLSPNGTYADGTMHDNAQKLVMEGITDENEIARVLGEVLGNTKRECLELRINA